MKRTYVYNKGCNSKQVVQMYDVFGDNDQYNIISCVGGKNKIKTIVDTRFVPFLKKISWHGVCGDTYIMTGATTKDKTEFLKLHNIQLDTHQYLHRLVMKLSNVPNPHGYKYVHHINREPMDNRLENLRWASQGMTNMNQDNTKRKNLPEGYTELPRFIVYNPLEPYGKEGKLRDFFTIEKHPDMDKPKWFGSKAMKNISIHDKLEQAKQKIRELEGGATTKRYQLVYAPQFILDALKNED